MSLPLQLWVKPVVTVDSVVNELKAVLELPDGDTKRQALALWFGSSSPNVSSLKKDALIECFHHMLCGTIASKGNYQTPSSSVLTRKLLSPVAEWVRDEKAASGGDMEAVDLSILVEWFAEGCASVWTQPKIEALTISRICAKGKDMHVAHPSVAVMGLSKKVSRRAVGFEHMADRQFETELGYYDDKRQRAKDRGKIRDSLASLFFHESTHGYEVMRDTHLWNSPAAVKKMAAERGFEDFVVTSLFTGEVLGGAHALDSTSVVSSGVVHVLEPDKGFVDATHLAVIDIGDPKWKFTHKSKLQSMVDFPVHRVHNVTTLVKPSPMTSTTPPLETDYERYGDGVAVDKDMLEEPLEEHSDDEKDSEESGQTADGRAQSEFVSSVTTLCRPKLVRVDLEKRIEEVLAVGREQRTPLQVAQLWVDAFNAHDLEALAACYSDDKLQSHQLISDLVIDTKEGVIKIFENMFDASSDFILETHKVCVSEGGDLVTTTWSAWCSDPRKELLQVCIEGCGVFEMENGVIVDEKMFWDQNVDLLSSLGVVRLAATPMHAATLQPRLVSSAQLEFNFTADGYHMDESSAQLLYEDFQLKKKLSETLFWLTVGAVFVYVVPRYLWRR